MGLSLFQRLALLARKIPEALIEGEEMPARFRKLSGNDGKIPAILKEWETKQEELKKLGMGDKEIINLAVDKRRNADLAKLTAVGRLFTKAEQVDSFMTDEMDEKERNNRLYLEVI